MTFDNGKTAIRIRLLSLLSSVIFVIFIFLTLFEPVIPFPLFGMSKILVMVLVSGLYILITFHSMLLNYTYLYFSDDSDKLIFRYYRMGVFGGKKHSVEIPKNQYAGYQYEKVLGNFLSRLVVYQRMQEGVAKYPPIPLNALKRKEKARILTALNRYAAK
jgi:hypothetical protein